MDIFWKSLARTMKAFPFDQLFLGAISFGAQTRSSVCVSASVCVAENVNNNNKGGRPAPFTHTSASELQQYTHTQAHRSHTRRRSREMADGIYRLFRSAIEFLAFSFIFTFSRRLTSARKRSLSRVRLSLSRPHLDSLSPRHCCHCFWWSLFRTV